MKNLATLSTTSSLLLLFLISTNAWSDHSSDSLTDGFGDASRPSSECFPESTYTRQVIERRFLDRSSSVGRFMRSRGHDTVTNDDIRLLTDERDRSICKRLNSIHSESILETQSQRGEAYAADAAEYDVTYYNVAEFYVAIVSDADPVSARDDMDIVSTGRGHLITVYDRQLEVIWSPTMR